MKTVMSAIAVTMLLGASLVGQEAPPNAPKFVKSVKAPGVDVRYLDFRWDEEAFATLEKGGTHPAGQRSWVLARLLHQIRAAGVERARDAELADQQKIIVGRMLPINDSNALRLLSAALLIRHGNGDALLQQPINLAIRLFQQHGRAVSG